MNIFPQLYTQRLLLRKLQVDDIPLLVEYANNKKISQYILNIPYPYREPDAVFRISYVHQGFVTRKRIIFAITLEETGAFIGEISLHLDETKKTAQLAYWTGESFWGRGLVTEAIAAVLKFGFERAAFDLVYATCEAENIASIKVLEKNGMKMTGKGGDVLQYTISREEYMTAIDEKSYNY